MLFYKKTIGKPKTDGTKSALLDGGSRGVEMPGRAGSGRVGPGRVATETEIRNEPPSKRAQEKIRRSGKPLAPTRSVELESKNYK